MSKLSIYKRVVMFIVECGGQVRCRKSWARSSDQIGLYIMVGGWQVVERIKRRGLTLVRAANRKWRNLKKRNSFPTLIFHEHKRHLLYSFHELSNPSEPESTLRSFRFYLPISIFQSCPLWVSPAKKPTIGNCYIILTASINWTSWIVERKGVGKILFAVIKQLWSIILMQRTGVKWMKTCETSSGSLAGEKSRLYDMYIYLLSVRTNHTLNSSCCVA